MTTSLTLLERARHMCDSVVNEPPIRDEERCTTRKAFTMEELFKLNGLPEKEPAKWSLRAIMSNMTP